MPAVIRQLPLRFLVPGLILVLGTLSLGGLLFAEWQRAQRDTVADMTRHVRVIGLVLSAEVEGAIRRGHREEMHSVIESLQGDPDLREAAVVGPDGKVLSATRIRSTGETLQRGAFPKFTGLVEEIPEGKGTLVEVSEGDRLRAAFPLLIRQGEESLLPDGRGYLLLEYDLGRLGGIHTQEVLTRGAYGAGVIAAITLILWAFFHYRLLRPVRRLSRRASRIGQGDFSAWPPEGGRDELGHLDRELAGMARRLEHNTHELAHQAHHDNLTGVLNRWGFEGHLAALLRRLDYETEEHALVYLDIDQFRVINDTWGHSAGDAVTQQVARILERHVFARDHVARLSGDEFALLLEECPEEEASAKADRLRGAIEEYRFEWQGATLRLTASLGVAPIRAGMDRVDEIVSLADTACYAAKEAGRNQVHLLREGDEEAERRHGEMRWVGRIQSALEEDRFVLYAQSIVPARKDPAEPQRFEILVRMRDENGHIVAPSEFLTAAERYHLTASIDRWVIRNAVAELSAYPDLLPSLDLCAINLSGLSLNDPGLADYIAGVLAEGDSSLPGKLCFEITETTAITHLGRATELMDRLQGYGCRFALDDFGSGVSSFGYLKNLPVDLIKIDGMFVRDLLEDPVDRAVVRAINDISHEMGKETVAEFVESEGIRRMLTNFGVDFVQGFAIDRPQPLERVLDRPRKRTAT